MRQAAMGQGRKGWTGWSPTGDSNEHVRLGPLIALLRRTPANQFSMQVHPELAGAKCLSAKHLDPLGLGIRHPRLPISDARASKFGMQLRGSRTFLDIDDWGRRSLNGSLRGTANQQ
jgi:hypothetical protein